MAAASLTAPAAITRKLQQCCCAAAAAARLRRWCLHAHPQQHQRLSSTRAAASPSSRESGRQETASQQVQCYVSQPVTDAASVPVPLCRRPGQFAEQLSALLQWRQTVLEEISSLKDAFEAADVGPAASELQVGTKGCCGRSTLCQTATRLPHVYVRAHRVAWQQQKHLLS